VLANKSCCINGSNSPHHQSSKNLCMWTHPRSCAHPSEPKILFSGSACSSLKSKDSPSRLPSVGFWSWSWFLAVSQQVTWVINPAVGCHYFPPGLQLPSQPLRGLLPILLLDERGTMGVNSLPKTVTRQRRGCDLNPGPTVPESSMLTTLATIPSHPVLP